MQVSSLRRGTSSGVAPGHRDKPCSRAHLTAIVEVPPAEELFAEDRGDLRADAAQHHQHCDRLGQAPWLRQCLCSLLLQLLELRPHELESRVLSVELAKEHGRQWFAVRTTHLLEKVELRVTDTVKYEQSLDPAEMAGLLFDEPLALAPSAARVLFWDRGYADHAQCLGLASAVAHQQTHQPLCIEPVSLRAPETALDLDARRINYQASRSGGFQSAMNPESIAAGFLDSDKLSVLRQATTHRTTDERSA